MQDADLLIENTAEAGAGSGGGAAIVESEAGSAAEAKETESQTATAAAAAARPPPPPLPPARRRRLSHCLREPWELQIWRRALIVNRQGWGGPSAPIPCVRHTYLSSCKQLGHFCPATWTPQRFRG
jgi:hypothetical protein